MGMREQEAIDQFKERLAIPDYKGAIPEYYEAMEMAVEALEEVQQYKAIGGTPELISKVINFLGNDEDNSIINDLELLNQYRVLGTVEELKEAKEKQIPKKPRYVDTRFRNHGRYISDGCSLDKCYECPTCRSHIFHVWENEKYCAKCGQALDWGNEDAG